MSDDSESNDYNDHQYMQQLSKWNREDDEKLMTQFKRSGHNWDEIARKIGKTSRQCQDRYAKINGKYMKDYDHRIEKKKLNAYWTVGDDVLLLQLVERFGTDNWKQISDKIKTKDFEECVKRYQFIRETEEYEDDEEEIDLTWTPKEDSLLLFSYRKLNGDWRRVLRRFHHRDINSLQQRWQLISQMQQVTPQLFWDVDRDTKIIKSFLNNRTFFQPSQEIGLSEELCENRFNYIIAKLSGQLEKRGVKVELPRKVQESINLNEKLLQQITEIQGNNNNNLKQQNDTNISLSGKYGEQGRSVLDGKLETITKFEIPQQATPLIIQQVKQDTESLSIQQNNQILDQQITNQIQAQEVEQQIHQISNEEKQLGNKHLIENTILLIEKSLEIEKQHFDSLFDIKDLLLQNII